MVDIQSLDPEVQAYIRQLRDEAAGFRVERNEEKARADEAEAKVKPLETQVTSLTTENSKLKGSVQEKTRADWLAQIAQDEKYKHIPASVVELLKGNTLDELKAAADKVAADVPSRPKPPVDSTVTQPENRSEGAGSNLDPAARALGDQLRNIRGLSTAD